LPAALVRAFTAVPGFLASWQPLYSSTGAIEIIGSPFETFADAEDACNAMLRELVSPN
jgi:hypothetical protein